MNSGEHRQRLDKWLWHARMVRTRALAAELITQGYVRVNAKRVGQSAKPVGVGHVLTIAFPHRVIVLEVLGLAERRGRYAEASKLYRVIEDNADRGLKMSDPEQEGPE